MSEGRIRAFDWLRGLAVLVMIQTHSLQLLAPALAQGAFYGWVQRLDGLVAPSFLLTAGFALGLVSLRAQDRLGQAKKNLQRVGEVLLIASWVNAAWFPVFREPRWLLRLDILHCVGLSLLGALGLLTALRRWPRLSLLAALGAGLGVFFCAPLLESAPQPWAAWVSAKGGGLFPLFPWAGYVLCGAALGGLAALRPAWLERLLGLALLTAIAGWAATDALRALYPPHDFWVTNPANTAQRLTCVLGAVLVLRGLERAWPQLASTRAVAVLTVFGTSSLSAYFFHEMLLFYPTLGFLSFARWWRGKLDWAELGVALVALWLLTYACVKAWTAWEPTVRAVASGAWARLTSREAPPPPRA